MSKNTAEFGQTLQMIICDHYGLEINPNAKAQFTSNYNCMYEKELAPLCKIIEKAVGARPVELLTYTRHNLTGDQTTSPHNFRLSNGKTLSISTTLREGKVAPKTVGQAGFKVLNSFFEEAFGREIKTHQDIKELIYGHIHELIPIFIDYLFVSDYNIFINREKLPSITLIKRTDVSEYNFSRSEFSFTRPLNCWTESITLKYHGKSIAEIQTHANRTPFKFRFIVKAFSEWFKIAKENNETFGMTAESAICDLFSLTAPASFATRVSNNMKKTLRPIVERAFTLIPKAIEHTGSTAGKRGMQSKCPYDFVLEGGKTLSVKTNKGRMVCPPEVGQPGAETCLMYFREFFPEGAERVTNTSFKEMVLGNIEKIMPIYVQHLFDSDWLLWIYETSKGYGFEVISQNDVNSDFEWHREEFTFTKPTIEEWNESNTIKYRGITIGEFQVHAHRSCFKFRFNLPNLLKTIKAS